MSKTDAAIVGVCGIYFLIGAVLELRKGLDTANWFGLGVALGVAATLAVQAVGAG